jgi:hypothetical protein
VSRVGELSGVALECRNPPVLAEFYSELTGWPVVYNDPDWYSVGQSAEASFHLSFQRSPGHQPPMWPDPASSMQFHLHFRVDNLDAAERTVLTAGRDQVRPSASARRLARLRRSGGSSVLPCAHRTFH